MSIVLLKENIIQSLAKMQYMAVHIRLNLYYFNTKMTSQIYDPATDNTSSSSPARPVRSSKHSAPFLFNPVHYLRNLRSSSAPIVEPKDLSEDTQALLHSICCKFSFTEETLALGIHFYQTLRHLHGSQKFWASSCLVVAGKTCELDRNVPYLNRYQRYADKSFSQSDYEQAERVICEALAFDLQLSTYISFLDFFTTRGVLFDSDGLGEGMAELFEADLAVSARQFLRRGTFSRYQPQLLALSIVKQNRNKYKLTPWPKALEDLTGKKEDDIPCYSCSEPILRELKELTHHVSNVSQTSSIIDKVTQKTMEKTIPRKKYEYKPHFASITKNTLKENSYSASKVALQSRKVSQPFMENFSTLNTDLLRRRG